MKKIGIFTFFQTNYGAVLQAYALQHYLELQPDTQVEIVDFTTTNHLKAHKIFQKQKTNNPFKIFYYYYSTFLFIRQLKRRIKRTIEFKKKYLNLTQRYSSVEEVLKNHPIEDLYITGSDQVFNPNARYVPVYFLNFDKGIGKKAAYAPSFGISLFDDKITEKISTYIKDFDFLSCREPAGAEYLTSITGKNVPLVVDPVLLHSSEEWAKIAVSPNLKKEYIFVYELNGAERLIQIAKDIQKNTGLTIVCLTGKRMKRYSVDKQFYDAGPAEFVGWIKDASYVVTDSFHGTVFSLIFKKQFFSFIAVERTSSRITNILNKTNLKERILTQENLSSFDFCQYNRINDVQLGDILIDSKKYINDILQ